MVAKYYEATSNLQENQDQWCHAVYFFLFEQNIFAVFLTYKIF